MNTQDQSKPNNWLDRKPFILSEETIQSFKKVKKTLHCYLCDRVFAVGDKARWIYANGTSGMATGNFFVCSDCDDEDAKVIAKAKKEFELAVKLAKRWGIYGPDWEQ